MMADSAYAGTLPLERCESLKQLHGKRARSLLLVRCESLKAATWQRRAELAPTTHTTLAHVPRLLAPKITTKRSAAAIPCC